MHVNRTTISITVYVLTKYRFDEQSKLFAITRFRKDPKDQI